MLPVGATTLPPVDCGTATTSWLVSDCTSSRLLVLFVQKLIGHPLGARAARVDHLQRLVADLVRLRAARASQPDLKAVVVARVLLVLLVVLLQQVTESQWQQGGRKQTSVDRLLAPSTHRPVL